MKPEVLLIVSIDTEEDDWRPRRAGCTVENIRELPRLDRFFERLGIRATYFTTYEVAIRPWAAGILSELRDTGRAEIGAHLHPWNTPPLVEPHIAAFTMLKNLSAELQFAKVKHLTTTLREAIGGPLTAFRAGRYALGPDTIGAILRCGYRIDSSVVPFLDHRKYDDGPSFIGAPVDAYRLDGRADDVRVAAQGGPLLEIPVSCGFSRRPFRVWAPLHRLLDAPVIEPLRLTGLASRTRLIKKVKLSPETDSTADMLILARRLMESGLRFLHLCWHSPSLSPGNTPYVTTTADLARFYEAIETFVDGLHAMASVRFATVSEAAESLTAAAH